ncbi:MAG: DUF11 domain-containing protein [Endozoicomonadaceae bacterium]|nr:DUF11 domain-containing protein [Endozoicomonadaceae bacterium]
MHTIFKVLLALFISQVWMVSIMGAKASVLIVTNTDANEQGFNDPTPFTPIGGNNAITLGEARLIAFQYAADKVVSILSGDHVITADISMPSLGGHSTQATLGGAGAMAYVYNFTHAPEVDILYPVALANKFFGQDIDPSKSDIRARFNRDIDSDDILTGSQWYYGLDGQSLLQNIDFVTVVMHELIHGLGFSSTVNLTTGSKTDGRDDVYSRHLYHAGMMPSSYVDMTDQQRLLANTSAKDLYWDGVHVNSRAQQRLLDGFSNNRVEIFAPVEAVENASLSHFSNAVVPNEMMEPFYTGADHNIGLAASVLSDIGWGSEADLTIMVTEKDVGMFTVTISNNGPDTARNVLVTSNLLEGQVVYQDIVSHVSCEEISQGVLCQLGDVHNGASVSYTLTVIHNTLNAQVFKSSVVANIVDVTPENNQHKILVEANSATSFVMASDTEQGGGGMINAFFMIVLLLMIFFFKQQQLNCKLL